jgi:hypothetical protein
VLFCDKSERRDDENDALVLFAKSLSTRICDGKCRLHVVVFVVIIGDDALSSFSSSARRANDDEKRNYGSSFFVHRDCLSRGRAQTQR